MIPFLEGHTTTRWTLGRSEYRPARVARMQGSGLHRSRFKGTKSCSAASAVTRLGDRRRPAYEYQLAGMSRVLGSGRSVPGYSLGRHVATCSTGHDELERATTRQALNWMIIASITTFPERQMKRPSPHFLCSALTATLARLNTWAHEATVLRPIHFRTL